MIPLSIARHKPLVQFVNAAKRFSHDKIIGRYSVLPIKLFRITTKNKSIRLREQGKQLARGSRAFDYTISPDGKIHPAPLDGTFCGPNGASFRPATINMWDILSKTKGNTYVLELPEGTKLPDELVMLHERDDHYSLQCTVAMTPDQLSKRMNAFISSFEAYPKETYYERYPLTTK
jgi:hypothetical protein